MAIVSHEIQPKSCEVNHRKLLNFHFYFYSKIKFPLSPNSKPDGKVEVACIPIVRKINNS